MPYFVAWKSFRLPWYKATSATAIHRQTDRLGIDNNQQHCLKAVATMARIEALNFCNALLSMWHYHEWSLTYVLVCYFEWHLVFRQHTTHCWCCGKGSLIDCVGQRLSRQDQANTLAHWAVQWSALRCVSLELRAGIMPMLYTVYSNRDACCLFGHET